MCRATGIHLSGDLLRLISLERVPSGYRLCALTEERLSIPVNSESLCHAETRDRLSKSIKKILNNLTIDLGRVTVSLEGGFFQIQKVPLEVASEEDRKRQIIWEVSQALISPPEEFHIDFYPAGRAAFWVAIRQKVIDIFTDLYTTAGISPEGFTVEPIALFHACEMVQLWTKKPNAAILLGYPWLSFVAVEDDLLMTAETVCLLPAPAGKETTKENELKFNLHRVSERVHRWIYGDLVSNHRGTTFQQVYFCGNNQNTFNLIRTLQHSRSPELIPLQLFLAIETKDLPEYQRQFLSHPGAFGIATGLAYQGLKKNNQSG